MSVQIFDDDGSSVQGVSWTSGTVNSAPPNQVSNPHVAMVINGGTIEGNFATNPIPPGSHVVFGHDPAREYGDGQTEDELDIDMDEARRLAAHRQRAIERELGDDPEA